MTHEHFIGPATVYHEAALKLYNDVNETLRMHGQAQARGDEFALHNHNEVRGVDAFEVARLRPAADIATDIMRARTHQVSDEECLMPWVRYNPSYPVEQRWVVAISEHGTTHPSLDDALAAARYALSMSGMSLRDAEHSVQASKMRGTWRSLRDIEGAAARIALPMTAAGLSAARRILGERWGLGGAMSAADFGRLLGFSGRDPGLTVLDYEKGKRPVTGPVALAVQLMLDGARPADLEAKLRR